MLLSVLVYSLASSLPKYRPLLRRIRPSESDQIGESEERDEGGGSEDMLANLRMRIANMRKGARVHRDKNLHALDAFLRVHTDRARSRDLERPLSGKAVVFSCPVKTKSGVEHGPTSYWDGFITASARLRALGCKLPIYNAYYASESPQTTPKCDVLHSRAAESGWKDISCHAIEQQAPDGYGFAKITAITTVPALECIFMDCDTFPMRDPTQLFDDSSYKRTGAFFWADVQGHFDLDRRMLSHIDARAFPRKAWSTRAGFDSGVLLVHKRKVQEQLQLLEAMIRCKTVDWGKFSFGDKDLWHYAWMLTNKSYAVSPFVGMTGKTKGSNHSLYAASSTCMQLSSQAKFDSEGRVFLLHQLW